MASDLSHQRPPERRFWYLKTPEGSVYGPTAWEQLRTWVEQGRVTADCQLAAGEGRDWQPADEVFAELQPKPAVPIPRAQPVGSTAQGDAGREEGLSTAENVRPTLRIQVPRTDDGVSFRRHHRGGLILVLGLLGLIVACPIFSLMAWVMGSEDRRAIEAGEMDPAGRDYTVIGQRLGMVLSILWIGGCMLALFAMLVTGYRG